MKAIQDPIISVDHQSRSVGCFDGPDLIRDFEKYTVSGPISTEQAIIANAIKWFDDNGCDNPRIIMPRITSIRSS
jgi:hypothetical protein